MSTLPLFDLRGRSALVTGSSRGIGRAIALLLAQAGANVGIHASDHSESLEQTTEAVRALGVKSCALAVNLADDDAAERLAKEAAAGLGQIDILVCNASVQFPEPWLDADRTAFDLQVSVNLRSTFELMQRVAPAMRERGWGRIITIGSVQEARPHPEMPVYAATKCAQTSLMRSLAKELAPGGVTANNVAPGAINTDRNSARLADESYRKLVVSKIPAGRIGEAEDCSGIILLLCSEAGSYITGQNIFVDGGMSL